MSTSEPPSSLCCVLFSDPLLIVQAEAKLRLFDFLIQSAAGGKINGGGSISMKQWEEVAKEIGKTPQACKDQMRRGIVPKVRKVSRIVLKNID